MIQHEVSDGHPDGRHDGERQTEATWSRSEDERRARELGHVLRRRDFARVLCSPHAHAVRTAELAGYTAILETHPDLADWDDGARDPWREPAHPGESAEAVQRRAARLIDQVREILERGEDILVISHPQIMRALAITWIGLPHHLGSAFDLARGAVSELGFIRADPAIIHWNAPTEGWGETHAPEIHQWFA